MVPWGAGVALGLPEPGAGVGAEHGGSDGHGACAAASGSLHVARAAPRGQSLIHSLVCFGALLFSVLLWFYLMLLWTHIWFTRRYICIAFFVHFIFAIYFFLPQFLSLFVSLFSFCGATLSRATFASVFSVWTNGVEYYEVRTCVVRHSGLNRSYLPGLTFNSPLHHRRPPRMLVTMATTVRQVKRHNKSVKNSNQFVTTGDLFIKRITRFSGEAFDEILNNSVCLFKSPQLSIRLWGYIKYPRSGLRYVDFES